MRTGHGKSWKIVVGVVHKINFWGCDVLPFPEPFMLFDQYAIVKYIL